MTGVGEPDYDGDKVGRFEGKILHYPRYHSGRYENPWTTYNTHGLSGMLRLFWIAATKMRTAAAVPQDRKELDEKLPVVPPDFKIEGDPGNSRPRITWIGHATVVLQMDGITVMTDPVFSERCSPFQWIGVKRYRPVPCTIAELPKIDAVVISHNHYDHLDLKSVKELNARFGTSLRWYVPAGTARWMEDRGCQNVVEMNWWEENRLPGSDVVFAFAPSQHWCKRGLFDYCKQLWGSWCILGPRHRFFFPGDTGYCEGFKEIGNVYGPFDGAAIPIGAYEPRWFMKYSHVNPEEAVKIHQDVRARKSIGIHWGTFTLTSEVSFLSEFVLQGRSLTQPLFLKPYLEPPLRLKESLQEAGLSDEDFQVLKHGGSLSL